MRKVIEPQMKIGEIAIGDIQFDPRSRDEIPKLLRGLQSIYCTPEIWNQVFNVLKKIVPDNINSRTGRKGMELWKIFVLGTLRLNCNMDYDKLHELANNHITLRKMLGHGTFDDDRYPIQTIKDNVSMLTPEILEKINEIVVKYGHKIVKKRGKKKLKGSCDSFVVETNVHYPTDINLLFDAVRKVIMSVMHLCKDMDISVWRQGKSNLRGVKKLFRKAQKLKRSTSKDPEKKSLRERLIVNAHIAYIESVQSYIEKAKKTIYSIESADIIVLAQIIDIEGYIKHAERQIEQIRRRVVNGEKIPHHEKVFSIFEEHTEWISKGKAGVPVELGLKVCIIKDQYGFILNHHVMQNETDDKIAVPIIKDTQTKFKNFRSCSFDKGFHSQENQKQLSGILDEVILPRKGRLSAINKKIEKSKEFVEARRKHSAVESSINALENHGLDRCLDRGIHGFKKYVALAVVARNIQLVGHLLQQKEVERLKRKRRKIQKAA